MACPTCDHTLERLTGQVGMGYYHCPRCGTVMVQAVDEDANQLPGFPKVYVPALVSRCREFEKRVRTLAYLPWTSLGIAEAIHKPEDRPADRTTT